MKKLLPGILALLMSFGCLAGCGTIGGGSSTSDTTSNTTSDTTSDDSSSEAPALTHAADLRDVKTAFLLPIGSESTTANKSYTLRNKFSFDGETAVYTINWSIADAAGNAVNGVTLSKGAGDTDTVIINVTEDTPYVLTATITCPDGCCTSEPYSINRTAVATANVPVAITQAPQENVPYKLYVYQSAISTDCFFTGEEKPNYPWYYLSDPDFANAIDLYIENVTGGFRIYGEMDGVRKYLSIVATNGHTSSFFMTLENLRTQKDCENAEFSIWTWDADLGTAVTMVDGNKCYMGCNGTYDTISAQKTVAANIYKGVLCEMKSSGDVVVSDAEKVAATIAELNVIEKVTLDKNNILLATQGSKYAEVSVNWAENSEYATITSGILDLVVPAQATTVTLTATVAFGEASDTKDFIITLGPKTEAVADKTDADAILAAAKNLAKDEELPGGPYTLTGQVASIDTAWDSQYNNITVSIVVGNTSLKCYRLKNADGIEAAATLKVGDVITVSGTLMNYGGKVQFGAGCQLTAVTEGEAGGEGNETLTDAQIVDAAWALAPGSTLGVQTLTGVVTEITDAYSTQYKNITFNIVVDNKTDKPIICYRTKGDLAANVQVGDTVTVTGELLNYLSSSATEGDPGKVEFSMGSITDLVAGSGSGGAGSEDPAPAPTPSGEVSIAEALAAASGTTVTFTGTVSRLYEEWSSYNNMSPYVTDGTNEILVFRTTTKVAIGDVITVTGEITVYNTVNQIAQGTSTIVIKEAHTCEYNAATCEIPASCKFCGAAKDDVLAAHNYVDGLCSVCNTVDPDYEGEVVAPTALTLSFADKTNRTSQTSNCQIWEQNGVKLTNNQGSSTSAVADYAAPARFYKSSEIIIECANITKIEFTCNSASYATALNSSIGTVANATVSVNGKVVTVVFNEPVDSFTIASLTGGQVRMDSLTVFALV